MVFEITHEQFQGPLDLLLDLIERQEMHVSEIALAKVAEDFIGYARSFADFPIAESAQFALICATLLLIKSKSLLPGLELSPEEQGSMEDLERRLKLLERFRALARGLGKLVGTAPLHLPRERAVEPTFAPPAGFSATLLCEAMRSVLASLPKVEKLTRTTIAKVISLEEMIGNLKDRVTTALRMSFKDFSHGHKAEKVHIIVSFLALLELVKQGFVSATQGEKHGDIVMETENLGVPRY